MDSKKEEQLMTVWHMVEGLVRAESLGIIGDFDRSSFREMLGWKGNSSELKANSWGRYRQCILTNLVRSLIMKGNGEQESRR